MPNQLPLIPAPRSFTSTAGQVDPHRVRVVESLLPRLTSDAGLADESYEIALSTDLVELRAATPQGLAYARTSWAQLRAAPKLPTGLLRDEPRFAWRGLMLDCARHWFPVAEIKALLDRLASLKLNRFHWHLVDDQGWRLEIPSLPRLTALSGAQFYSVADVAEVVAHAARLGITVVPEIELPGHSSAALAAYPDLSCTGGPHAIPTTWGIFEAVYCASSETAAKLLETILAETCRQFPGPWVHLGGDEVVRKSWEACPRCQAAIADQALDGVAELEAKFLRRMVDFVRSQGKTAIGWNEVAEHAVDPSTLVQWWHRPDLARHSLQAGHRLLSSSTEHCYFDYPYAETDAWFQPSYMKPTPVRRVYENPVLPPGCDAWQDQVVGGECCLWTEHVLSGQLGERLDGRLEAFAEVYWSFEGRPGWDSFAGRARALGLALPHS